MSSAVWLRRTPHETTTCLEASSRCDCKRYIDKCKYIWLDRGHRRLTERLGKLRDALFGEASSTQCDRANETCPVFPGGKQWIHWSFDDPAPAAGGESERLAVFRRVRDEIRDHLRRFVAANTG